MAVNSLRPALKSSVGDSPDRPGWNSAAPLLRTLVGRWMLVELTGGGRRYHEIHDALDGISYKVLTGTLRPRHWRTCEPARGPIGCWAASPPSGSDALANTAGRSESTEAMVTRSRGDHRSDG